MVFEEVADGLLGGHGDEVAFAMAIAEIGIKEGIGGLFDELRYFEGLGEDFGLIVLGGNDGDMVLTGVRSDGEANGVGNLDMNDVGMEIVESFSDFGQRENGDFEAFFVEQMGQFFAEELFLVWNWVDLVGVDVGVDGFEVNCFNAVDSCGVVFAGL